MQAKLDAAEGDADDLEAELDKERRRVPNPLIVAAPRRGGSLRRHSMQGIDESGCAQAAQARQGAPRPVGLGRPPHPRPGAGPRRLPDQLPTAHPSRRLALTLGATVSSTSSLAAAERSPSPPSSSQSSPSLPPTGRPSSTRRPAPPSPAQYPAHAQGYAASPRRSVSRRRLRRRRPDRLESHEVRERARADRGAGSGTQGRAVAVSACPCIELVETPYAWRKTRAAGERAQALARTACLSLCRRLDSPFLALGSSRCSATRQLEIVTARLPHLPPSLPPHRQPRTVPPPLPDLRPARPAQAHVHLPSRAMMPAPSANDPRQNHRRAQEHVW